MSKAFIRVVEVWVPDAAGTLLEFGSGWYGDTRAFGAISRRMCFGRGEGLPGQAWEQRRPIMLKDLGSGGFLRTQAAAAEGLNSAVAWPVFAGDALRAVVLILCGDDEQHVGAIELWRHAAGSHDMVLDSGSYGGTAEVFAFLSQHTAFRRGTGLPGLVWEQGMPVFMPDLGHATKFLRAESARQVGINRGFALPCSLPGGGQGSSRNADTYVMAFLSALATPIARRLELWTPVAGDGLSRVDGFCEQAGPLAHDVARTSASLGLLAQVAATGVPGVSLQASAEPGPVGEAARAAGLTALVALPVLHGNELAAVVAWYF